MAEENYKLYVHTSPSGRQYVGITRQEPAEKRWQHGAKNYANNVYFCRAILKYGWENFSHEVICDGMSKEEAALAERMLISVLGTRAPYGYNETDGGFGAPGSKANVGSKRTPQQRANMSEIQKKMCQDGRNKIAERNKKSGALTSKRMREFWAAMSPEDRRQYAKKMLASRNFRGEKNPNYGKHASEETKAIWHKQRAGRQLTDEWRKHISETSPMCKAVLCKETGVTFRTLREAAEFVGVKRASTISDVCKGKLPHVKGYHFEYAGGEQWQNAE